MRKTEVWSYGWKKKKERKKGNLWNVSDVVIQMSN
jgi:hypothetical protein